MFRRETLSRLSSILSVLLLSCVAHAEPLKAVIVCVNRVEHKAIFLLKDSSGQYFLDFPELGESGDSENLAQMPSYQQNYLSLLREMPIQNAVIDKSGLSRLPTLGLMNSTFRIQGDNGLALVIKDSSISARREWGQPLETHPHYADAILHEGTPNVRRFAVACFLVARTLPENL